MDDTDDKVRRNLVAVSAAILAIGVLELPLPLLVARLFEGSAAAFKPSAFRLWLLTFLALAYLQLRFHFATTTTEVRKSLRESHAAQVRVQAQALIRRKALSFSKGGRDAKLFRDVLARVVNDRVTFYVKNGGATPRSIKVVPTNINFVGNQLSGGLEFDIMISRENNGHQNLM